MKTAHVLVWGLMELAIVTGALAQPTVTSGTAGGSLATPTSTFLALSNSAGELRVLDVNGLVLETNFAYLPRIKLADLSGQELHALLENKTAYTALTVFGDAHYRNAKSAGFEDRLRQIWTQGTSLADKIQTRLEIFKAMRDYNNEVAALPGTMALASQTDAYSNVVNQRWAVRADVTMNAATQVDNTEVSRAYGNASRQDVHDARQNYDEAAERLARANNRAMVADSQAATAHQMVTAHEARCAALSARLASYGISVASTAPFYPIPSLALGRELDPDRTEK